jgi:folylpolyglutamate synthase/dihydropteroate synthase
MIFVIAVAEGKDMSGMLESLSELPAQFICTTFRTPHRRSAQPRTLALIAEGTGAIARAVEDPIEALSLARRIADSLDLVVVTGSTYLVGELRDWFLEHVETHGHAAV